MHVIYVYEQICNIKFAVKLTADILKLSRRGYSKYKYANAYNLGSTNDQCNSYLNKFKKPPYTQGYIYLKWWVVPPMKCLYN